MADLKTNYKDDVLDTSKNTKRKYKMIQNADGTVSFEDVTVYKQEGDSFGGADINATNEFCNSLNQSMPLLYHNGGKCDLKFGYSVGVIELTNSDATYSVSLPTPPTGYNYDSYKTTITCVASTNGLAYTFFNVSVSDNICKFKVKCLSGDRYDGGLYLGVHAMMTNA